MLPERLADTIATASSFASRTGAASTDLYHLLLALADDSDVQRWLRDRGASHGDLREAIFADLDLRQPSEPRKSPMSLSPLVILVLERAYGMDAACPARTVMEAVCSVEFDAQEDFPAAAALRSLLGAPEPAAPQVSSPGAVGSPSGGGSLPSARAEAAPLPEALAPYCRDLVAAARLGLLDPVFGREAEIGRTEEVLCRKRKANPVLVGEAGVGKTAVVEGLAARIASGAAPASLASARILALDVAGLIAGTRNRGDFEERLDRMVKALEADRDLILFVDEIHVLVGGVSGAVDAANLLKPALASGRMRCIGATTHAEFARYFDADPAMARRFQQVKVDEPSRDHAVSILSRAAAGYEAHHGARFTAEAVEAAVDLTARYVIGRQLPDKALDAMDEAGARAAANGREQVTAADVRAVVSRMSGVPIGAGIPELVLPLVGQDAAVRAIRRSMARAEIGVRRRKGARVSMLFVGPDGSGKAYAAECLAAQAGGGLVRIAMSSYREPHSVSRLIGSPPGYVGHGSGGQLTEAARRNPSAVILFERVDHAHPDVVEVLQAAVSRGELSDAAGRTVSFAGTTLVFTSGQGAGSAMPIGFAARGAAEAIWQVPPSIEALASSVDSVIAFEGLGDPALRQLAAARFDDLVGRLRGNGMPVDVRGDVAAAVAQAAAASGTAAGLERTFRDMVEDPLLEAMPGASALAVMAESGRITVGTGARP